MILRQIALERGFLHLPVRPGGRPNELQLWVGGVRIAQFSVELADTGDPVFFFLDLRPFRGTRVAIVLPRPDGVTAEALAAADDGPDARPGNPLYPNLYRERLRPLFHFSSRRGWLNDPNGLVHDGNHYHLYYQHNPLGTAHGGVNISWGHAVSRDLIHWRERSDAILPWRRDWHIASGSALLDARGDAGCGENAIIAAFTALGSRPEPGNGVEACASGGQFIAVSTDGGDTFLRLSETASIPVPRGEPWRDPRLFRYGDGYRMAVYETLEGRNCVTFYASRNLLHWERAGNAPDIYECPDLFELTCPETGESRWALYGADGLVRIGRFDGRSFVETEPPHPLDYGGATYAGQTWNGDPAGRTVHIGWVRGMDGNEAWDGSMGYEGMPFSQCMTLPCELRLTRCGGRLRVSRSPVAEAGLLRGGERREIASPAFPLEAGNEYEINAAGASGVVEFAAGGRRVLWDSGRAELRFGDGATAPLPSSGELSLRLFVDKTTVEWFFSGRVAATFALDTAGASFSAAGECRIQTLRHPLKQIWDGSGE